MSSATVKQLRHEFPRVYAAARRGPVRITKHGKVIATLDATPALAKPWSPPDFTARSEAILGSGRKKIDLLRLWAEQGAR